jgi:hypothetical protein
LFDRTRGEANPQTTIPAEIALADGRELKGKFLLGSGRSLHETLNSNVQFLEFETHAGERSLIAKSTLLAVKVITVPSANSLNTQRRHSDSFDPYAMLKVERGAKWEDIRRAYLSLSKIYHPDRYASVELPPEVKDYLSAMISRINAAYTALEDANAAGSEAGSERKGPIYTSQQRS